MKINFKSIILGSQRNFLWIVSMVVSVMFACKQSGEGVTLLSNVDSGEVSCDLSNDQRASRIELEGVPNAADIILSEAPPEDLNDPLLAENYKRKIIFKLEDGKQAEEDILINIRVLRESNAMNAMLGEDYEMEITKTIGEVEEIVNEIKIPKCTSNVTIALSIFAKDDKTKEEVENLQLLFINEHYGFGTADVDDGIVYTFVIEDDQSPLSGKLEFTIAFSKENYSFSVEGGTATGGTILGEVEAKESAQATPEDAKILNSYSITGGNDDGFFAIDMYGNIDVEDGVTLEYTDGASNVYTLTIEVTGTNIDQTTGKPKTQTTQVTISVLNPDAGAPEFDPADYDFSIQENNSIGDTVGTVSAVDPDSGAITYEIISGNDRSLFEIDSDGNIKAGAILDFETDSQSYILVVTATDIEGKKQNANVNIALTNDPLDDPQEILMNITNAGREVSEPIDDMPENAKNEEITFTIRNAHTEDVIISYALNSDSTADQNDFTVNGNQGNTGTITIPAGERQATMTIGITADDAEFRNEVILLDISATPNNFAPEASQIKITIRNDANAEINKIDYNYYADPFAYTGEVQERRKGSTVNSATTDKVRAHPGAAWPFGMVQLTPVNAVSSSPWAGARDSGFGIDNGFWLYHSGLRRSIKAFATTFLTGPGCQIAIDFPFMADYGQSTNYLRQIVTTTNRNFFRIKHPYAGNNGFSPYTKREHRDDNDYEYAEPGYYRVTYQRHNNASRTILAEFTVTERTGFAQFTFPSDATHATIFLTTYDGLERLAGHELDRLTGEDNAMKLSLNSKGFCEEGGSTKPHTVFKFDRQFNLATASESGHSKQARLIFELGTNKVIKIKIGRSFVSHDKALDNIKKEQSKPDGLDWNFSTFRTRAYDKWKSVLSRIAIIDGEKNHRLEEKRIFYSTLYQALLHPNVFSDADGEYRGFDGRVHNVNRHIVGVNAAGENIYQKAQYQNYSVWDTYRGQHQVIALLDKEVASDIAQSLINNADQSGCTSVVEVDCTKNGTITRWGHNNNDTGVMNGDPGPILVASSFALGATKFNLTDGYDAILRSGIGTIIDPKSNSGFSGNINETDGKQIRMRLFTIIDRATRPGAYGELYHGFFAGDAIVLNPRMAAPWSSGKPRGGTVSNFLEFAASDFAKAQFVKGLHDMESDAAKKAIYADKYKEIMNLTGDDWKKMYIPYKEGNKVVFDIVGRDLTGNDIDTLAFENQEQLRDDDDPSYATFKAAYDKYKPLLDRYYDLNNYSITVGPGLKESGKTFRPYDNGGLHFREGESNQYRYMLPFDLAGLFKRLGSESVEGANGKVANTVILEKLHKHAHEITINVGYRPGGSKGLSFGNQPSYSVPYVFNYTGLPHYAQFTIRKITNEIYDDAPNYSMAGNDDLGSLSAQYVWPAIGLYPAHGSGVLHVVSPRFKTAIVRDDKERILMVSRARASDPNANTRLLSNKYILIKSMKLNGQAYDKIYIRYQKDMEASVPNGGLQLDFVLDPLPNNLTLGRVDTTNGDTFIPKVYTNADYRKVLNHRPDWGRTLASMPPSGSGGLLDSPGCAIPNYTAEDHNDFGDFPLNHTNY